MNFITPLEIVAALIGLGAAVTLVFLPRFGPASWALVCLLVPASAATGVLSATQLIEWPLGDPLRLSLSLLLLTAAAGFVASYGIEREDFVQQLHEHRSFFGVMTLIAPLFAAALYMSDVARAPNADSGILLMIGPAGYGAAVYLLIVSVIGLANLEQTLRGAEEHVRWEIKFVLLGMAAIFGALVYIASTILLYTPADAFVSARTIRIFPAIFLCGSVLILMSWSRATGHRHIAVSQSVVYSTITFLSVGLYLIASGLLARWTRNLVQPGIPIEPIVFLLAAVLLTILLLGTAIRHRARIWIRRNIFAGKYDYRRYWMGATERVRSTDSTPVAANALADLIVDAIGTLDVSVWLRAGNSSDLYLAAARGSITEALPDEVPDMLNVLIGISEPMPLAELSSETRERIPDEFLAQTQTSLLAPLISSDRLIGLVTIGTDRSGRPFDRETREFLRVLALHAAGEFHKSELLATLVAARESQAFQTFSTFLLHDLKNFASTLSLIAKNASRHHANPDFQRDAFQSVLDTSEKMKKLCSSLRSFSSTLATNKRMHDLNAVAKALKDSFDAGMACDLELELGDLPLAFIDPEEMTRVLHNLVLNAIEASSGTPVRVTTRKQEGALVVEVQDRGKGIPREFMEQELFQPFHTTKKDGLGIGLFQSRKIVEAHQGTIEVRSTEGTGTLVRILLPVVEGKRQQAAQAAAAGEFQILANPQTAE